MGLFDKIFGSYSDKQIKKIKPLVQQVLNLEQEYRGLSEAALKEKTPYLKEKLARGASLDDILPEAFATVREASARVLNKRHYPVQLMGGTILHQGRIAEMKTGEGKTLVATLPVYLNALAGKGVHVVTVNDYLASRDSEWMGKVYRYLGLSVGLIVHGMENAEKRVAYQSDLTYCTNNELGFDYLRDNMVTHKAGLVQRELNFAIVDEVDSILIDEARTPLIISGPSDKSSELYMMADRFVKGLRAKVIKETESKDLDVQEAMEEDADYIVDETAQSAVLTTAGTKKAEAYFHVENLNDAANFTLNHHINNALKANGTMHRDKDYIVSDGEVVIVDDFTGRLMEGRRYSNGLHQAIEAKEGVTVQRESKTYATITFQNLFRLYHKLSGMTGTALTEEEEFQGIYQLDCVAIPTNKPMIRKDYPDAVFLNEKAKFDAVIRDVSELHEKGQPVLIGTISVDKSEKLSQLFTQAGIPHNVLNAKQHAREAEIVAQAGRLGAVTISTNMAGRGTDIMLGGNPEYMAKEEMEKRGYLPEIIEEADAYNETDNPAILEGRKTFQDLVEHFTEVTKDEKKAVVDAGGLFIIGTERHESRRIDNQLRGRSGRQGDPGASKFYMALSDDLIRLFGGQRITSIMETVGMDDEQEISHPLLSRTIESAQRRVEQSNYGIRKHVLQYDDVMNQQREIIYKQRREVLEGKDLQEYFMKNLHAFIDTTVDQYASLVGGAEEKQAPLEEALDGEEKETLSPEDIQKREAESLRLKLADELGSDLAVLAKPLNLEDEEAIQKLVETLNEEATAKIEQKKEVLGSEDLMREIERRILLNTVDAYWMEHIDEMDTLRDSIGMRAYAQHDPVVEYKREGSERFNDMSDGIRWDSLKILMRSRVAMPQEEKEVPASQLREYRKSSQSAYGEAKASHPAAAGPASSGRMDQNAPKDMDRLAAMQASGQGDGPQQPVRKKALPGRNDPCWCGSGKKYKNCHWKEDNQNKMDPA